MTDSDNLMSKSEIIEHLNAVMNNMSRERLLILLNQLKGSPSKWNRKFPRKACIISVDFDTADYSNQKIVRNLSAEGAYIEVDESFSLGQEIILWFTISDGDKKELSIKVPARVVRRDSGGIGVKFEKLTRQKKEILKQYEIKENADSV